MVSLNSMYGQEKLETRDAGSEMQVHASEAPRLQYHVPSGEHVADGSARSLLSRLRTQRDVIMRDDSAKAGLAAQAAGGNSNSAYFSEAGPRALLSGEKEGGIWQYFLNLSQGSADIGKVVRVEQLITSKVSGKYPECSHVSLVDAEFSGHAPYAPIREVDLIACPLSKVRLYQAHKQSSFFLQE